MNQRANNEPGCIDIYPKNSLNFHQERRVTLSKIEDIPGFKKTLDDMQFTFFPDRALNLIKDCPFFVMDDPRTRLGDQRFATGVLFKSGPRCKVLKPDSNFFSNKELWAKLTQDGELLNLQLTGTKAGPIRHTWVSYGSAPLPKATSL